MGSDREGVSPFSSEHVLAAMCGAMRAKGVFDALFGEGREGREGSERREGSEGSDRREASKGREGSEGRVGTERREGSERREGNERREGISLLLHTVARLQPSHYLVDTYLEQSLMDPAASHARAIMVLDSVERHYLDHQTGGAWFERVGMPGPCQDDAPEQGACLVVESDGVRSLEVADESFEATLLADPAFRAQVCEVLGASDATGFSPSDLLLRVSTMPLRVSLRNSGHGSELVLAPVRTALQQRFAHASYRQDLFELLRSCGCDEACLDALVQASFAYGLPFQYEEGRPGWRIVLVDLGYLAFRFTEGTLADVRAGILVTDRSVSFDQMMLKDMIVYQWHITDICDQRCKHCYLFAEDAQARCMSTPWDMLIHTLDEVEDVAARRHLMPVLAVSGGDPILHPRFWDFAAELKRRGIRWSAMGNPFHLDADVCRHLRRMGCYKYQLSLDGLERFHDYLRKPGSFRATLDAIEPLQAAGIKVQLMATASRQNLDDILACMDLAAERGVESFTFARYCATSPEKAAELYPTPEEYHAFMLAYWRKKQAFERAGCKTQFKTKDHLFCLLRWELGEFEIPAQAREHPDRICGGCHLGAKSTIAVNGDLLACRRMESVVGNVWNEHLYDVDEGPAMRAYAEVRGIKKCKDCELLMWCRGCRAVGYNATGDLQAADPMCWKQ